MQSSKTADKMETEETTTPKRLLYAIVLLLSFLFFTAGFAIEQTFRWTNHFDGFMNGLIQGAIFGVTFCLIFILPWSLLIHALCRWRRSQESPNPLILAPPMRRRLRKMVRSPQSSWAISCFISSVGTIGPVTWAEDSRRTLEGGAWFGKSGTVPGLELSVRGGGILRSGGLSSNGGEGIPARFPNAVLPSPFCR